MASRLLLASATPLLLTLAGCGGNAPADAPGDAPSAGATAPAAATGTTADPAADPAAAATPTPGASATPTPGATASATPAPSASAAPTARPTTAAAAAPAAPPAAFTTCGVCHSVQPGQHMIGPSLAGVVGRRAGTAAGFSAYSSAMRSSNVTWNDGTLDRYLADPAAVVAGGAMPAPGVDAAQRRAIIAYLKTL